MDNNAPKKISDDLEWPAGARQVKRPPEEFENPPGVGGETCDVEETVTDVECDPAEAEDLVMEESKPGLGIEGYEGEEVGGG
jgi:hypothetical protein